MKTKEKNFITAIDLGSDSIRAICAKITKDGKIEQLWYATSPSYNCIINGWVDNLQQANTRIKETMMSLTKKVGSTDLGIVVVCAHGHNFDIKNLNAPRNFINARPINSDEIENITKDYTKQIENKYPALSIIETIPYSIEVDGIRYSAPFPTSLRGKTIRLAYSLIYAKKEKVDIYKELFNIASIQVDNYYFRPHVLLSLYSKIEGTHILEEGCGVLDLGAQTSNLILFKKDHYLDFSAIDKGGNDITNCISQLGISLKHAEELKCKFGYASPHFVKNNAKLIVPVLSNTDGKISIDKKELANIILPKLNEILSPLISTINHYAQQIHTIYLTGGASMLHGIDKFIQSQTTVNVVYGFHDTLLDKKIDETFYEPKYASLIGLLYVAKENQKKNKKSSKTILTPIIENIIDLFTNEQ